MAILTGVTNKRFDAASLAALLVKIKASHDAIMGSLNPEQYTLTSDTELINDKTYYTEADGVYTAVETPSVDDIASYYEVSVPAESREYTSLIELERAIKTVAADTNINLENLLNSSVAGEAGKFVKNISFSDGKITAEVDGLNSIDKTIVINEYDLSVNIDGVTLEKDENGKISVVKNAVVELVELTTDELTALGENNIQTAYKLIAIGDDDRTKLGDLIKVAKDSSVKNVHIGVEADGEDTQKLYLTYILADGSESQVAVDFSSFIAEAEMGDGMIVVDHKITINIDEASEAFLTVGEGGLKLEGVQVAIDAAKAEAIATVLGELNAAQYVLTTDTELVDGKTYYTETDGVYTAVETPEVANIASYYEVSTPAETREYNTLIEAERAIEALQAGADESSDRIDEIISTADNASFTEPTETAVDTTYTVKFVGEEAVNEILSIINDVKTTSNSNLESYKTEVNAQLEAINGGISTLNDVVEAMNEDVNDLSEASEAHTTAITNLEAAVPAAKAEAIATVLGELNAAQYVLTTDTELVDGKTYYTETDGVYTAVETPEVANIASYYEVSTPAESREYNTLIEAERAIEALKAEKDALQAEKDALQAEYDQFKQDVVDTFGYSMNADDVDAAWTTAGL